MGINRHIDTVIETDRQAYRCSHRYMDINRYIDTDLQTLRHAYRFMNINRYRHIDN